MTVAPDLVRKLLLNVWGEQACQVRPADWPDALARLMETTSKRGSYKPLVDDAVTAIGTKLEAGADITGPDIWQAFSKLDAEHCDKLAALLRNEMRAA